MMTGALARRPLEDVVARFRRFREVHLNPTARAQDKSGTFLGAYPVVVPAQFAPHLQVSKGPAARKSLPNHQKTNLRPQPMARMS